jgi:hypothetical protein
LASTSSIGAKLPAAIWAPALFGLKLLVTSSIP